MATEDATRMGVEKFNGADFAFWRMQVEDYLVMKKLHEALDEVPDGGDMAKWNALDREALGAVRLTLSKNVAHTVINVKTTYELMKALATRYETPTANNKVHLMTQLFNMKMKENENISEHVNHVYRILNQLTSLGINFDDEIYALYLLGSLPDSWQVVRTAISNSASKSKLSFDDVRNQLLDKDVIRKSFGYDKSGGFALSADSRGRSKNKGSNIEEDPVRRGEVNRGLVKVLLAGIVRRLGILKQTVINWLETKAMVKNRR